MKTTIFLLLLILGLNFNAAAQTKSEDFWIGDFGYSDSGMNATGTRSYVQTYNLEIKRENGKLRGYYSATENGDPQGDRLILDVKINGGTASFFYNGCDAKNREESEATECSSDFKTGDLMLKMVKSTLKNKKTQILTYWGKIKLDGKTSGVYFAKSPN